ncbi:WD repeat-containing protein 55 homolog [Anoplophora glabripennis]|nr:WD repeat-containing protein 55 homolog [Anoplophora glabripennis]
MCKNRLSSINSNGHPSDMEQESDSDISETDSELEENEANDKSEHENIDEELVEENEEDETIKAIIRQCNKERNHPTPIECEDFITDISFHPHNNILAISNIIGDVLLYKYSIEENILISSLELHTKACRDIEFSCDGNTLFSTSKDKSVMISDVNSGKLERFYENCHEVPVYCLTIIDENMFSTGDDDGVVKIWDVRERDEKPIYKTKKNEDYISDMITDESKKYLLCSSGDGSLTTINLQNRKVHMQSEEYEEELTCLGLFRSGTKLISGSSKGKLFVYNWEEFGLHSDAFPGPKTAINSLIPITENIVVTACEDGNLRATHLFPHRHLGIVGQHDFSIECVDICSTGQFIASSSHNNDIKFWNIEYFEDFDKVNQKHKKHKKKTELQNNLPSSKIKNVSDFFSDMC